MRKWHLLCLCCRCFVHPLPTVNNKCKCAANAQKNCKRKKLQIDSVQQAQMCGKCSKQLQEGMLQIHSTKTEVRQATRGTQPLCQCRSGCRFKKS